MCVYDEGVAGGEAGKVNGGWVMEGSQKPDSRAWPLSYHRPPVFLNANHLLKGSFKMLPPPGSLL